jgi:hypothetical protein
MSTKLFNLLAAVAVLLSVLFVVAPVQGQSTPESTMYTFTNTSNAYWRIPEAGLAVLGNASSKYWLSCRVLMQASTHVVARLNGVQIFESYSVGTTVKVDMFFTPGSTMEIEARDTLYCDVFTTKQNGQPPAYGYVLYAPMVKR